MGFHIKNIFSSLVGLTIKSATSRKSVSCPPHCNQNKSTLKLVVTKHCCGKHKLLPTGNTANHGVRVMDLLGHYEVAICRTSPCTGRTNLYKLQRSNNLGSSVKQFSLLLQVKGTSPWSPTAGRGCRCTPAWQRDSDQACRTSRSLDLGSEGDEVAEHVLGLKGRPPTNPMRCQRPMLNQPCREGCKELPVFQ